MNPRSTLRAFFGLSVGHVSAKALGFLTAVLLARSLDSTTLGLYASLAVIFGFTVAACNWGTDALGIRAIARDPGSIRAIASSVSRYRLVTVSIASLAGIALAMTGLLPVQAAAPLILCLLAFAFRKDWALLASGDVRSVNLALLSRELVFLALVFVLLPKGAELQWALWCLAAAEVAWTISSHVLVGSGKPSGDGPGKGLWFREGWPIAIVSVMTLANNKVDVPILAALRGPAEAGAYWAAYNILFAAMAFAALLTRAVLPEMSRKAQVSREHGVRATFALALMCGAVGCVLAVLISLGSVPLMTALYPGGGHAGAQALRLLAWALPAHFLAAVLIGRVVAEGRQRVWTVAAVSAGTLNIILNLILIPKLGMQGSAVATIASETCLFIVIVASFRGHASLRALLAPYAVVRETTRQ